MQTNAFIDTKPASTSNGAVLTVCFDGACPVCSREIAAYRWPAGAWRCAWVDLRGTAAEDTAQRRTS
jgi:predicted DCC family thiol-disulfide oxidoreductase YuxK